MRFAWRSLYLGLFWLTFGGCVTVPVCNFLWYSPKAFDAQAWRAGDVGQRARMVHDLVRSSTLMGRTQQEVIELLGPPDNQWPDSLQYFYVHHRLLDGWLDLPFSNWREWLMIEFDPKSGRVIEAQTQD
jgi:hypothetical protein